MITPRRSNDRGTYDHGWLRTRHTFSFADYHDPRFMGFRSLRVINEDVVAPGRGFGMHAHRDMEILTWVLSGSLEHRDSMGTGSIIRPGDAQRMSAGTGVMHSETNASSTEPVHFLQIWILPAARGITPSYEQKAFDGTQWRNRLALVASRDGREGSITVQQSVDLYASILDGSSVELAPRAGRGQWLQVTAGTVQLNGEVLSAGDGAAVTGERSLRISSDGTSELLLFDLE